MKTIIPNLLAAVCLLLFACTKTSKIQKELAKEELVIVVEKAKQEAIVEEYLVNGAKKKPLYSREREEQIDEGLKKDSTIAYLWQQKAMPLFKQGKYEAGMVFVDKAVKYDRERWQDYRAFIKCIFAKTYREAILDFEDCKLRYGNSYVMDHTYDFHIALSYLQLNEFEKAEQIFKKDIAYAKAKRGEDWLHHLDLFYYGISIYEQKRYEEAIVQFDRALQLYPEFSDVQYYKAICLNYLGQPEDAQALYLLAEKNAKEGYTINEDNVIYERYPYQIRWGY